jgi:hypothetical protein
MKKITLENYAVDRCYPRIVAAVEAALRSADVVSPIDVLVSMELLDRQHVDDWRKGRVPYLEKVIKCNLEKASRILRILRFHAHDLNLLSRATAYRRRGRGRTLALRFSKSGDHQDRGGLLPAFREAGATAKRKGIADRADFHGFTSTPRTRKSKRLLSL